MNKGIKMNFCRKLNCGNTIFHINKINKDDNSKLICEFCSAKVMYVSSHPKRASKKPVSAYLRLWPNEEHEKHCRNTVKNAVYRLVSDSRSVENSQSILEREDDTVVFRLNLLKESLISSKTLSNQNHNINNNKNTLIKNKYIKIKKQLDSYFTSAVGVARIRAISQDNEINKVVKIKYKNEIISWNDFYYDERRYYLLSKKLKLSSIKHPIAIKASTKRKYPYSQNAKVYPFNIQCFSEQYEKEDNKKVVIPNIRTNVTEIFESFVLEQTYILVGEAWLSENKKNNTSFCNINIAIQNQAQFKLDIS